MTGLKLLMNPQQKTIYRVNMEKPKTKWKTYLKQMTIRQ